MAEREWRLKLAKAIKENDVDEIGSFLAYLHGYLECEENGKFQKLMTLAMQYSEIEKSFYKQMETNEGEK